MHGAPSVSHPVGRSSWAAGIFAAVWIAAALVTLAWMSTGASGWRAWLAGGVVVALGVVVSWSWWFSPQGSLAWDGARWTWAPAGASGVHEGAIAVVLDLQQLLLVRWSAPAVTRWFWLQPQGPRSRWEALRRAVYSRAGADAPSGAEPPSATP